MTLTRNPIIPIHNDPSDTNGTNVQIGASNAGSAHAGGMNVRFADGHVAFLKSSMSKEVWRAMGTRNGNEVVNDDI